MTCRGLHCTSTKLINAHIIPKGFARAIRSGKEPLLKVAPDGVTEAMPQLGEYDPSILCANCDGVLGKDDEYALRVCREFKAEERAVSFEIASVDTDRFSKFILSLLWRASISKRSRFFGVIGFGPYEAIAREAIFGERPIRDIPAFKLIVSRLRSEKHDVSRIITDPIRFRLENLNGYSFFLNGFRLSALIDGQDLPSYFDELIVNRTKVFRGVCLEFEELPEFTRLVQMLANKDEISPNALTDNAGTMDASVLTNAG